MKKKTIRKADYDNLVSTMEDIDYLNDEQRKNLKTFFAIIALPSFKGEVVYDQNPTQISIDEWKDNPGVIVVLSNENIDVLLSADISNLSKKRKMLTHYRVFETTNDKSIPISCGREYVHKIIDQIKYIDSDMGLNKGIENTLYLRKTLMEENIKNSLEKKHYERENEIISHFAENFHNFNWEYYTVSYHSDIDTFMIKFNFDNCMLRISCYLNRNDNLVLATLYRFNWLTICPTEMNEDFLASHLSEFINGELTDEQGGLNHNRCFVDFTSEFWDKERDTPKRITC